MVEEKLKTGTRTYELSEREFGDVQSHLWKLGYKGTTEKECRIYHYYGPAVFDKALDSAFRLAMAEMDYLKLTSRDKEARKKICRQSRWEMFNMLCHTLPHVAGKTFSIGFACDRVMKMYVMHKYLRPSEQNGTLISILIHAERPKPKGTWEDEGEDWKRA